MRNIAIIPGLLALILTGVLFYVVYHKPSAATIGSQNTVAGQPLPGVQTPGFRMAYFNLDTLEARYQYFKDVLNQVKAKENDMNAELGNMEKGYQRKIAEWQKKGNTMTQAEGEQAQQEYAKMQQEYQIKKQTLQEALLKNNEDLKADIRRKIDEYLKEFNKAKGYNYIISYEANSFIYIKDTANNITNELIEGLNADYKKK